MLKGRYFKKHVVAKTLTLSAKCFAGQVKCILKIISTVFRYQFLRIEGNKIHKFIINILKNIIYVRSYLLKKMEKKLQLKGEFRDHKCFIGIIVRISFLLSALFPRLASKKYFEMLKCKV
jgi:hypothetical protein